MNLDIAIVGGGLAGCSSAIRLAQKGLQVALFEAGDYPRHKVCGEFMSHGCQMQFEALGVDEVIRDLGSNLMHQSFISTPDGTTWKATLPGTAIGISRYKLDIVLAERAKSLGTELFTQSKVVNIEGTLAHGFILSLQNRETVQAQVVLGAYGKRSTLDKKLKRPFLNTQQPFIGLKQHFRDLPIPDCVELHTFTGGYCGISQVEDGITNVCLLVREDIFRQHSQGKIDVFIDWMKQQNPFIADRLEMGIPLWNRWLSISQVPFIQKSPIHRDIFMLGDAAGMISPLTGDGMEIALQSGEIAAKYVTDYFLNGKTSNDLINKFCQAWNDTFHSRIQIGRVSQFFMFRPHWLKWGLRTFNTIPALGDFFIQQTRHTDSVSM
ncbi:MAG: NAD(P)/FAD-dependent oxidoreductase [Chloroflexota bacterium]